MSNEPAAPSAWTTVAWVVGALLLTTGALKELTPYVVSVMLGLAVGEIFRLRHRLRSIEQRMRAQEAREVSPVAVPARETAPAMPAAATPLPVPVAFAPAAAPTPGIVAPRTDLPRPATSDTATPIPVPSAYAAKSAAPPAPTVPAVSTVVDRWKAAALSWLKRGNPVARAGVVILFFGGSFLAKYAAEHSLFPIELRMAALAVGALALLGIGWRLREKARVYGQTLQGGGIAGFYLSVFAATRLYHLVPQGLALGLMIVVALAAAVLAVTQEALALAVIGTGGGFLAPILLSTGGGSLLALFSYYSVLNLGVFAVAWFRAWRVLNLVGFVFTFGIAGLFRALRYGPDQLFTMDSFLLLFFLLYVAVSVLFSLRQKPDLKGYVSGSLVFGLPLVAFGMHASLMTHIEYGVAYSALGFAFFYVALALLLRALRVDNLRLLIEAFAALAVIFGSLAIPLAFDYQTTSAMWAVEGAGLLWIGIRQDRRLARAFGAFLQLAGGIGYWLGLKHLHADQPILNSAFIGSVMLGVSGLLSGWWLFRNQQTRAGYEKDWERILALWGVAWWLGGGLAEVDRFAADYYLGADLALAAATAALLLWIGQRREWPLLPRIAAGLLALTGFLGLLNAAQLNHAFAHAGWAGWLPLAAAIAWLLHRLDQKPDPVLLPLLPWLHAGGVWLIAVVTAWESGWQIGQQTRGVWSALPWGLVPALLLWLCSRRPLLPEWPLARHEQTYRVLAAVPLAVFGAAWTLAINLGSDGDPGELIYLPLLNPLDITVALLFAAIGLYWRALSAEQRRRLTPADPRILPGTAIALVFLWLNAALIRALHYCAGAPLTAEGIFHSMLVQAALSIFWGVLGFAAMTLAARRSRRDVWMVGAGLMAVVVLKLFLVDTAGRGTLARIVSFLTVGALLLVTGYLSPLPPRKPDSLEPAA